MFLAQTLVIVFLFAVLGSAALCVDGLTAISAFEFVAEKVYDLYAMLAVMVFLYFGAHFFKNVGRNDLWEHVLYDLSVKMIDARILFVFQYIINGAADERFSLIGNASAVEFEENIFYIHAYGILLEDKAHHPD